MRPLDVVKGFYAALGRSDADGALALLAPDVEWTEAERFPYYSGTWHGPEAVLNNLLKRLGQDWEDFSASADDFVVDGDRIVSLGVYAGTYKSTGKAMRASFAHVWTVHAGKVTRFLMYTDTAKVLEALKT